MAPKRGGVVEECNDAHSDSAAHEGLAAELKDWRELEDVLVRIGRAIGFFQGKSWEDIRWVIHTSNPLTDMLWATLEALKEMGAVEMREGAGDYEYRWMGYELHGVKLG